MAVVFAIPSLNDGLVSDDYELIAEGIITSPSDIFEAFTEPGMKGFYRPLPRLLIGANYALHGLNGYGYHLINAALHVTMTAILTYLVFSTTGIATLSVICGVLFASHFAHVEPVYWISARNELLAAVGYLLALTLALRTELRFRCAALVAFLLALLSKETAITLPLTLSVLIFMRFEGELRQRVTKAITATYPFIGVLVLYCVGRFGASADWPWTSSEVTFGIDPYVILRNLEQYSIQLILPVRTLMDLVSSDTYSLATETVRSTRVTLWPWLLLAAVGLGVTTAMLLRMGGRLSAAGMAFTILTIMPFLFMEGTAMRYLYLPSAGFSLALAGLLHRLPGLSGDLQDGKHFHVWLVRVLVAILLMHIFDQSRWWERASLLCSTISQSVIEHAKTLPADVPLYVYGIPRRVHGAYVFHNGFEDAIRLRGKDLSSPVFDGERVREYQLALPPNARILDMNDRP